MLIIFQFMFSLFGYIQEFEFVTASPQEDTCGIRTVVCRRCAFTRVEIDIKRYAAGKNKR